MKTARPAAMAAGASVPRAPAEVATPLPPRKPKKTGKTWPSTTATAALPTTAGGASRAPGPPHRRHPLDHVERQHGHAGLLAGGAHDVGGPGVAAPHRTDVQPLHDL